MATLKEVIQDQEHTLGEKGDIILNFNKFLSAHPPNPESPHIDLQIQQAVEELRRLKAEHIELRTKELFMKAILTAKSLDDLPTSQETGRAEVSLQEAKRDLRKIKAERRKAEQTLVTTVEDLGNAVHDQKAAREEAQLRLRQARTAFKAADVYHVLNVRDVTQMESLIEDIDELDAPTCRDTISVLSEERETMERKANKQSMTVENLRKEVEELESDVRNMSTESNALKLRIAEEDERNATVAKLRHEWMLQKEVESILTALTGIRISEIRGDGISLEINATLLVPLSGNMDRSKATHTLDITFDEEEREQSHISSMRIRPGDIDVEDLHNGSSGGNSLVVTVQMVCSRLAEHILRNRRSAVTTIGDIM